MSTATPAQAVSASIDLHRDLEDLRQGLLTWLAPLALVTAWVATYARLFVGPEPRWLIGVSLAAGAVLSLFVRQRRPALGRLIFAVGALAAAGWLMWLAPHSASWQGALVALLLISPLFAPPAQLGWTAMLSLFYVLAEVLHPPVPSYRSVLSTVGLLFVVSASSWLSTQQLLRALEWATANAEHALTLAERLRERQQRLNTTVKALDESQYRIERANRELALARNQAEEARQFKSRFAAILSHELRAPLNLIVGFTEMMVVSPESYGEPLPRSYRADLHEVYRSSRAMLALVEDLLDLAQIEARQLPIERDEIDLLPIVEESLGIARSLFRDKPITFSAEVQGPLQRVYADRTRVRQVLLNLLGNAGRFTDQGSVTVRLQALGRELQVTVADTGVGISPDGLRRIFAEFRQVDRSVQRKYGGTGLGLAVSKELIELHGGRMWAESQQGVGSQFHFTLPLVGSLSVTAMPIPASPGPLTPVHQATHELHDTFLVLGDDPLTLRRLQRHIQGYRALAARDVAVAASLVAQLHPRAIVVPLSAGATREHSSLAIRDELFAAMGDYSVPLIFLQLTSQRQVWREMGVKEFLQKPVSRQVLLSCLESVAPNARNVLLIDDEPGALSLMRRLFRSLPGEYDICLACGGQEGLQALKDYTPDLVLLDLLMPEVDGLAVLAEMQKDERLRAVPVVIVTAQSFPDEVNALQPGRIELHRREALTHTELVEGLQALLNLAQPRYVNRAEPGPVRAAGPLGEPAC